MRKLPQGHKEDAWVILLRKGCTFRTHSRPFRNRWVDSAVGRRRMEDMPAHDPRPTPACALRCRVAAAMLGAAVAGAASAQWTTPPVTAPGVEYRLFQSTAAGTAVSFHVFLPPAYAAEPARRFPVLYWLHGSGNPTAPIAQLTSVYGSAMAQGRIPPMIVVFPNGMNSSMWCDSKDGHVPMETVVLDDLIPHVDATFRTIAQRSGRILDGFSMGGAGSGRLGFRRPDLFAGVSMLGAGPIQTDFMDEPDGSTTPPEQRAAIYEMVWGSDPAYYTSQNPRTVVAERAEAVIAAQVRVRQGIGSLDSLLPMNQEFDALLTSLAIPHSFTVVPGVDHLAPAVLNALGQANWDFYNAALAIPCRLAADIDCSGTVDGVDLGALLGAWGPGHGPADLDGSGMVDGADLGAMLAAWGPVP
jgi:enterochelin esterase-like enzyme